tara:strand:- start:162 stop:428 length:267 start_codon:yes stop_codon:yes gene_type:complete
MTSSINRKIQEQIKENKILEKQKAANAEALINNIEILEPEPVVEVEVVVEEVVKEKAKAKAKPVAKKKKSCKKEKCLIHTINNQGAKK